MKIKLSLILLVTIMSSFHLERNSIDLAGFYYRGSGTVNDQFEIFDDGKFKYSHWCDICFTKDIYGTWYSDNEYIFLNDTLVITYENHFQNQANTDSTIKKANRIDSLKILIEGDDLFLCKISNIELPQVIKDKYGDSFACFKRK